MLYAAAHACIGVTPNAYAADVTPSSMSGFGLGIYRCAGDLGAKFMEASPADSLPLLITSVLQPSRQDMEAVLMLIRLTCLSL